MDRKVILTFCIVSCASLIGKAACRPQMSISPAEIVLTSSTPVYTTMTCYISPGISITTIYNMQILRLRESLDSSFDPVCQADSSGVGFITDAPSDIVSRGNVSGGIDTASYSDSILVLTRPTEDVLCNDKGTYQCKLVYQDTSNNVITLVTNNSLSIYALPSNVNLIAHKNGDIVGGTIGNPVDVNIDEVVDFTCTAYIGSENTTLIRWRWTSGARFTKLLTTKLIVKRAPGVGTADDFVPYNPPIGSYSDGTPSYVSTNCRYSRIATMTYNVTLADKNRQNNLAFQCFVSVIAPNGQTYETQNPPTFYINPTSTSMDSTSDINTGLTSDGGCFVLLVSFLSLGWTLAIVATISASYMCKKFYRDPNKVLPTMPSNSHFRN